jgi:hypothetical protein
MRKLLSMAVTVAGLSLGVMANAVAAPVQGFGAERDALYQELYNAVISACSGPAASSNGCRLAITAYSDQLIADGVPLEVATASFAALRSEVAALNGGNVALMAQIEGVFEELLPEVGSIGPDVSPA